jgi:hypothetical protein
MRACCLAVLIGLTVTCLADPADSIVLLQPDQIIGQRLKGDAKDAADFMKSCMDAFEKVVPLAEVRSRACFVVAIGRGYRSQGWVIGDGVTELQRNAFNAKLQDLNTPELKEGFVAFEVLGKNSEAAKKHGTKEFAPPLPDEWKQLVAKEGGVAMHTDQVLERLLTKKAERSGPANRGQPVGSETNRTSAGAGPGG